MQCVQMCINKKSNQSKPTYYCNERLTFNCRSMAERGSPLALTSRVVDGDNPSRSDRPVDPNTGRPSVDPGVPRLTNLNILSCLFCDLIQVWSPC